MIQVGKIFLKFDNKKLVALAIYENGECNNFLVLKEVVEGLYDESRPYYMIPDLFADKGLLGTNIEMYNFLASCNKEAEIIYEELITLTAQEVKKLQADNPQLY